jgi:hypothetical protein
MVLHLLVSSESFLLVLSCFELIRFISKLDIESFSIFRHRLAALLEQIDSPSLVLGDERYFLQLIPPFVRDLDRFLSFGCSLSIMPFLHGLFNNVLSILFLDSVEDVEEV